jgi:hypothetical protein
VSGIIGHSMYALLGLRAAQAQELPIARVLERHLPSYLCGAYLGCDVGTLPAAICQDTGQPVGYGAQKFKRSPLTSGAVKPWTLEFGDRQITPLEIHQRFYGRAHLAFGWHGKAAALAVTWEKLPDYFSAAAGDAIELFGPGERPLAYCFGWMTHVVGDGLIKSIAPGLDLHLLDGKYTPANRPIQDLMTFHEIGVNELGLDWPALLRDLVETPIEPAQTHYMRAAIRRGRLGKLTTVGWRPQDEPLLLSVLAENRRYQRIRNGRILKELILRDTPAGPQCDPALSARAKGLSWPQMKALAEKASFRHALWQMGERIAEMFAETCKRQPLIKKAMRLDTPTWKYLTTRWSK